MLFTGDTLAAPERRRGLAVEPMTCPPNALQSGEGVVRLAPGDSFTPALGHRLRPPERAAAVRLRPVGPRIRAGTRGQGDRDGSWPTRATAKSYARGASSVPLLEETIGANLDRTVARFGDREALVSCAQQRSYTYDEFADAVDQLARGLIARRPGSGATGWGSGAPTAPSGRWSSTRRPSSA